MEYNNFNKYIGFIFQNYFDDFVNAYHKRLKNSNLPVLKYFKDLSDQELITIIHKDLHHHFNSILSGNAFDTIHKLNIQWKEGRNPDLAKDQVVLQDIIEGYNIRKECLIEFIQFFTTHLPTFTLITVEINAFYSKVVNISMESLFEVQQEIIIKEKQFTDTVLNSVLNSIVALRAIRDERNDIVDFEYILVNKAANKFLRVNDESILGKRLLSVFPSVIEEGIFEKYIKVVTDEHKFDVTFYYQHEGFKNWFRQIGNKWEDGLVIVTVDVTAQKNAEISLEEKVKERTEELENKNKELIKINADLDNFIYTASHDLKAPISNLEGLVNAITDYIVPAEESGLMIDMIGISISKFKNTIKDLTEITKVQKNIGGDVKVINIEESLGDVKLVLKEQINKSKAEIIFLKENCNSIRFSPLYLNSIFYNLLSNAIKYRSPERSPVIEIKCTQEKDFVVIQIKDNGLGIKKGDLGRIFGMFKRYYDHVEGSGMGLYLVKRIVENSGGKIEVESAVGKGSVFRIYLKAIG